MADGSQAVICSGWSEEDRVAAIGSYDILDTPREAEFDDIARIAADVCGTEVAIVNFLDSRRQFFKAEVGFGGRGAPIEVSFCKHAVHHDDVMVVPDATKDPLFASNPVVVGAPHVRFYAGAVIRTSEGIPIGTVCVLGMKPQELGDHQVRTLRLLAKQAMTQLDLRRALVDRQRALEVARNAEREFRDMTDSAPAILWVTDAAGRCNYLNKAWYQFTGQTEREAEGYGWLDATHPDDAREAGEIFMAANARQEAFSLEYRLRSRDGSYRWAVDSGSPRFDASGTFIGYVGTVIDIDGLRRSEERRQVAMGELSHRMKNGLSMVQAIVSQSLRLSNSVEEAEKAISGRIGALASAQDLLVRPDMSPSTVAEVVEKALLPHVGEERRISSAGPAVVLAPDRAIGIALALHELATNSVKYGALSVPDGRIAIAWSLDGEDFGFEWVELGGPAVTVPTRAGFGSRLLERVVPGYFSGKARREFEPAGMRYVLAGKAPK
jgi:PAS domain S-box-containing protein